MSNLIDEIIKSEQKAYDVERQHQSGSNQYFISQTFKNNLLKIIANTTMQQNKNWICDSFVLSHPDNSRMYGATEAFKINDFESTADWTTTLTKANDSTAGHFWVGAQGINLAWTTVGTKTISYAPSAIDFQNVVGVTSGTPSQGTAGVWLYAPVAASQSTVKLRLGNDSSNYKEYNAYFVSGKTGLVAGLNYLRFDLDNPSGTAGTIDWTGIDYVYLSFVAVAAAGNFTLDYLTCSKNNNISLNGLGRRVMAETIYDTT